MALWHETIQINWSADTFEENRDATVEALKESGWYKSDNEGQTLQDLVEELADTDNPAYFDAVWNAIYDEADFDRIWLSVIY